MTQLKIEEFFRKRKELPFEEFSIRDRDLISDFDNTNQSYCSFKQITDNKTKSSEKQARSYFDSVMLRHEIYEFPSLSNQFTKSNPKDQYSGSGELLGHSQNCEFKRIGSFPIATNVSENCSCAKRTSNSILTPKKPQLKRITEFFSPSHGSEEIPLNNIPLQSCLVKRKVSRDDSQVGFVKKRVINKGTLLDSFVKFRKRSQNVWNRLGMKYTINVMNYLSLTEASVFSECCYFVHRCYRMMLLNDYNFTEMDLSKYSEKEIIFLNDRKFNDSIKSLFKGKNLVNCIKNTAIRYKSIIKGRAQRITTLEILPQNKNTTQRKGVLMLDNDLAPVLHDARGSLQRLFLVNCDLIGKLTFDAISSISSLRILSLSGTKKLCDDDLKVIVEGNRHITQLDISECPKITGTSLNSIVSSLYNLKVLVSRGNSKIMEDFTHFEGIKKLIDFKRLDLSGTEITDTKLQLLIKYSIGLEALSIRNCNNLSLEGFKSAYLLPQNRISRIVIRGCHFLSPGAANTLRSLSSTSSAKVLIY